jgi:hypothetical protein
MEVDAGEVNAAGELGSRDSADAGQEVELVPAEYDQPVGTI